MQQCYIGAFVSSESYRLEMQTCLSLKTQLSSILDIMTKAAVTEISKLISEATEYAPELHLEMIVSVNDSEALGRRSTITPIDITTVSLTVGESVRLWYV